MALTDVPRVSLGVFPTPLRPAADLSGRGLTRLLVKRDDLTGFAWGGNKVRTLEYVLADALAHSADSVVVAGGPTSNFAALLAGAAAGRGLAVSQVCYGEPRAAAALTVSRRAGAHVEFTGSSDRSSMEEVAAALAERLRGEGGRPYVVPRGGASPVGACGFAAAADELDRQLASRGVTRATVVLPVGSGGSIAGLLAGLTVPGRRCRVEVVGVSVSRPPDEGERQVTQRANECARLIGARGSMPRWRLVDGRGRGYGGRSPEAEDLAERVLLHGGLVADPVYNAKALLWLEQHRDRLDGPVVYWSTGGALASADDVTTPRAGIGVGKEVSP